MEALLAWLSENPDMAALVGAIGVFGRKVMGVFQKFTTALDLFIADHKGDGDGTAN